MKTLILELRSAIMATLILAVVCCGLYPLVVFGIGQLCFKDRANGSLMVESDGTVRGSVLLAQGFSGDRYFHPRPSVAGANGYDPTSSSGSNLGPTSRKLNDAIKDRVAEYRTQHGLKETDPVPADAVTASGSGLDPHISVVNARIQAGRVARARNLRENQVLQLVRENTTPRQWGILGEPGVNVLTLNLSLDRSEHR